MFEFKPASSNPSLPQPQHYQSLPHSSKRAIFNPFRFNELHTLGKTTRGTLPPSHFGTRSATLQPARTLHRLAITTFVPPCRNSPPPYTIKPTGAPRLSRLRDQVIRFFK